jgi:hypothetical protein
MKTRRRAEFAAWLGRDAPSEDALVDAPNRVSQTAR